MDVDIRQGPNCGRQYPAESEEYRDPETGACVRRLTTRPDTENRHLYFTEPGWYADGEKLLFLSDRGDDTIDLYSLDLTTDEMIQLTDLPADITGVTRCATRPTAYFWHEDVLVELELDTRELTPLYELPPGYQGSHTAATADGERVVTAISETLDLERETGDREDWIAARMEARPHSQVLSIPTDGGEPTVHVNDDRWLNHVNASPTRPALVTYCEEGPWEEVDRIWVLDLEADETWPVRRTAADEAVGHEYWLADGEYVGYHGWRGTRESPDAFFGQTRYDDTDRREGPAPDIYTHFHSNTRDLVVGDGTHRGIPHLLLWRWDATAEEYETPRKLATHGWDGDDDTHPHSRLSPTDGRAVFDSTNRDDASDVYLVDIPADLDDLPTATDLTVSSEE